MESVENILSQRGELDDLEIKKKNYYTDLYTKTEFNYLIGTLLLAVTQKKSSIMESLKEAHKNHSCATNMIKIERFRKNFNCIALTNDNMDKIPIILSSNLSKEVKSGKYQSLDESICPTDMYSQQDKIKGESPPKTCNFEDLPSKIYIQGKPNPNGSRQIA